MTETTLKNTKVEENEGKIAADTKPAKPYEFRTLNATDVFPMLSIISKIGVNEFTACFEKEEVANVIKSLAGKGKNKEQITSIVGVTNNGD